MALGHDLQILVLSQFNILATTILALSLYLLEDFMDNDFACTEGSAVAIVYSVIFMFVPFGILVILGYSFSNAECPCDCDICQKIKAIMCTCNKTCFSCCSCCCMCKDCLYTTGKILKPPFLWLFILLADGKYLDCLVKASRGGVENPLVKPISQMVGLGGICMVFLFSFQLPCSKKQTNMWYPNKYEDYLIKEVEESIRKRAIKSQEDFVMELVNEIIDNNEIVPNNTFNAKNPNWMERLEVIIYKAKKYAKRRFQDMINVQNMERSNPSSEDPSEVYVPEGGNESNAVESARVSEEHNENSPILENEH